MGYNTYEVFIGKLAYPITVPTAPTVPCLNLDVMKIFLFI